MEYTVKQLQLVEMVGSGESITDCAKKLDVTRRTIYSWMEVEGMRTLIQEKSSQTLIDLSKRIASILDKKLSSIEAIFTDKESTTGERIRAYGMLLRQIGPLSDMGEFQTRILRLENKDR